ncbi:lipoprotein [Spiroplasma endosymbiont of Dactylopius coccus]
MKKLLSMIGAMILMGTASANVVACGGGENPTPEPSPTPKQKIDLNTKIKNLSVDILFDANKTNQELDSKILSDFYLWVLKPRLVNPTIKYFSDAQGKTNVSNQKQKAGDLYVVITADNDDTNYQGSTNLIKISLKQYKLSDITQLIGLNLTANSLKKFKDFDSIILNNDVFKDKPISYSFTTVTYYEYDPQSKINSDNAQRKGNFWVVIKTDFSEPNWYGETQKIKITIN